MSYSEEDIAYIRKWAGYLDEDDEEDIANGNRCTLESLMSISKYNERVAKDKDHKDMTINEFFEKVVETTENTIAIELEQLDMNELIQEKEKFDSMIEHEDIDASYQITLLDKAIQKKEELSRELEIKHRTIAQERKVIKDKEDQHKEKIDEFNLIRSNILDRINQLQKQFNDEYIRPDKMNENSNVRYRNLSNIMNNNIKKLKEDIDHNHKRMEYELEYQRNYDKYQDNLSHLFIDEHLINYKLKNLDKKSNILLTTKRRQSLEKIWKEESRLRNFYLNRRDIEILSDRGRKVYLVTNMNYELVDKLANHYPKMLRAWDENMTRYQSIDYKDKFKQGNKESFEKYHEYDRMKRENKKDKRVTIVCNINMIPPEFYDLNNVLFLDDGKPENWFKKIDYYVHRKNEVQKKSIYYLFYELDIMKFLLYQMYFKMNVKH